MNTDLKIYFSSQNLRFSETNSRNYETFNDVKEIYSIVITIRNCIKGEE
jgi:hypothetical protein